MGKDNRTIGQNMIKKDKKDVIKSSCQCGYK